MASSLMSRLVIGRVMHRRRQPVHNKFVYPLFFMLLDLDELDQLDSGVFGVNRRRPLAFHFRDYGDGRDPRLWIPDFLRTAGIHDCDGRIRLQSLPRVFGYLFNPVSFWYCERRNGQVGAIIAEVNNTFGERQCYLLRPDAEGRFNPVTAEKRLYVSPFFPLRGGYIFRFNLDFDAPRVSIDYYDQGAVQLNTAVWGHARPWSNRTLISALLRQPILTLGVTLRIHWQALKLWQKGLRLVDRPRDTERHPGYLP
ncbi:MAG: DUF1365 domain-containing protein [Candidatus Thiodiazotropha sp.]